MDKKRGLLKDLKLLFSPIFTGVLFIVFVIAMAVATFIENDFGAASARQIIYNSRWFELIFILMVINMTGQIFSFKLYRRSKLTVLLFHLAFIVMIVGAGITRYFGYEGTVHIREGQSADYGLSRDRYMGLEIADEKGNLVFSDKDKLEVTGTSLGVFYKDGTINNKKYLVKYSRYLPNASEEIRDIPGGSPMMMLMVSKDMYRENIIISAGERIQLPDATLGFNSGFESDITLSLEGDDSYIASSEVISQFDMMTREQKVFDPGSIVPFGERGVFEVLGYRIIPQRISFSGQLMPAIASSDRQTGKDAFEMEITYGTTSEKLYVYNIYGGEATSATTEIDGVRFKVSYGPERLELPFTLKLTDFILERYPGSSSPMGYQSDVILLDEELGINMPYSIYMNNILKHRGYRFFQSSYDPDERGTILSLNHDRTGMLVTYTGYTLLFLFIILSMLNRKSVFWKVSPSLWRNSSAKILGLIVLFIMLPSLVNANPSKIVYNKEKAEDFGNILIQDQKGRTKPLYTLSNDVMRKVHRHNKYGEFSPMQVFLGLTSDFRNWQDEPLIKVSNRDLRSRLGMTEEYIAISALVDFNMGTYVLADIVEEVYSKPSNQRSKMDKEVIKVDERVNIVMMIARGEFLKVFPLRDGTNNWSTPVQTVENALNAQDSIFLSSIFSLYTNSLFEGLSTGNYSQADQYLDSIIKYQRANATYELPSEKQVRAEIRYYKMLIFEKLFPFYATVGIIMLLVLIVMIVSGRPGKSLIVKILSILVLAGFVFHTYGLGVRWYISGHSPMSNGYESLLFISWVTVLVGLGFGRKSALTLAATAVLASLTLMVAHLSFMDPEITNLVPVLQSYWLTLHVSVITASYGFLGLGAILGLVNMILYALENIRSRKHVLQTIDELSVISYRSLTLGLYFLTIGTFLGAVWANESWGRYWGWDPKETWSLITIFVYAFVIHAKNIRGLKSIFSYNLMSVYAFFSVLMTYFGVNYYLSGLHSYAGGDPVPVPSFVYYTVASLIVVTLISYRKYKKLSAGVKDIEE